MKQLELLHEGKSKMVFKTDSEDRIIIQFKDDVTAFYNIKHAKLENKGKMTCEISSMLLGWLNEQGVNTHFVEQIDHDKQLCRVVKHLPFEVIVRNAIAGSMAKRLGLEEGIVPENVIFDLCLRSDELGDPLINDHHAVALGLASYEELEEIYNISAKVNELLSDLLDKVGINLIDFKIVFGRDENGELVLADELTPDTCRLWEAETGRCMDKDRFRRDMGHVNEMYEEVACRISEALKVLHV